jgi:hypothetical protein
MKSHVLTMTHLLTSIASWSWHLEDPSAAPQPQPQPSPLQGHRVVRSVLHPVPQPVMQPVMHPAMPYGMVPAAGTPVRAASGQDGDNMGSGMLRV